MKIPSVVDPLLNWDPKLGRFHSIWATQAGTEWASKYGVLPEYMDPTQLFHPYGKSGLTPNAKDNPKLRAERRNLQKWILFGFWPELLEEMGAYPYDLDHIPTLTNAIDSLFHLKQWQQDHGGASWPVLPMEFPQHTPFHPVEPDNTGRWTAYNPAVWRRLDPILRLVTRFLNHSAATDWLDAFYFGLRSDVPDRLDRRPGWQKLEHGPLQFFHKRDTDTRDTHQTAMKTEAMKSIMKNRVQFGIGSGALQPWDRTTPIGSGINWEGYTIVTTERKNRTREFYTENKAWIEISLELLMPLFRHDLSVTERLCCQFYIASVILHEFAHSLNQLQDSPMGRTIPRNEPAYGGDSTGKGAEVFCELGYSFTKGLFGAMPRILNPGHIVGAPVITVLLSKEIPARKYDKGIFLHEAGADITQFEETNALVPIVSKYYEKIHTDEFWESMARNIGVSMIQPIPAPILVVEPDPLRPELSSYCFNETRREWMVTVEKVVGNAELLSTLDADQRRAYEQALIQKDEEHGRVRRMRYLDLRVNTAVRIKECHDAIEDHFSRSSGELSDTRLIRLFVSFAEALEKEADHEAQCAIDFICESDPTAPSSIEFSENLLFTNQQIREMTTKTKEDCSRVGVATLGGNFQTLHTRFDRIMFVLRAVHFILTERVKPSENESYEEVIERVGNAIRPDMLQHLQSSDVQHKQGPMSRISLGNRGITAYHEDDLEKCHEIGRQMLSQFDMEGYFQGIGLVLVALHPGEVRRRWCARQGLHVLEILFKSRPTHLMKEWVRIAKETHDAIEDEAVTKNIGNDLCVLGID